MDIELSFYDRVDDMSTLSSLLDDLLSVPIRLGTDVETTGLDCHTSKLRLFQFGLENGTSYVVDCFKIPKFLTLLADKLNKYRPSPFDKNPAEFAPTFAFHNGSFDIKFLWANGVDITFYNVADSFIGSKVYECGLSVPAGYHKLDAVAKRWANVEVSKEQQKSDWSLSELSMEQIEYAAKDPVATVRASLQIENKLKELDLWNTYQLECRALFPTSVMEFNGVLCDIERLNNMRPHYESIISQSETKFKEHLPLYTRTNLDGDLIYSGLNMGSSAQVLRALTYCGVPEPDDMLTEDDLEEEDSFTGVRSTGSKHLKLLDLDEYPVLEPLMEFRAANKLITSYFNSLPDLVNPSTGRIHPSYNQMVSTGRYCIAENTPILLVGETKPIQNVNVGDLAYTYDDNRLTIRKVVNKWFTGVKKTVKVSWKASGNNGNSGYVVCTPDHRFKTVNRGWVEAQNLKPSDKIYHVSRRPYTVLGNSRPRLYGTGSFMQLEQSVIKKEYFNAPSKWHIHHKDYNSENNLIYNLEVMTASDHCRLHGKDMQAKGITSYNTLKEWEENGGKRVVLSGKDHHGWVHVSRYGLLKMLYIAGGRPTKVPMDFETYKRKCKEEGIDLSKAKKKFNKRGEYLSKRYLMKALTSFSTEELQSKHLGIGTRKLHDLKEYYGIDTNHCVVSVVDWGYEATYDLEIEGSHNFIASELCVHNSCSSPNLQQIPRPGNDKSVAIRHAFMSPEGYYIVQADYSQIELRVMAVVAKDEEMIKEFKEGKDPYAATAAMMCGVDYSTFAGFDKSTYKSKRQSAKPVKLGFQYGMSARKFKLYARQSYGIKFSAEECVKYRKTFFGVYKGLGQYHKELSLDKTLTSMRTLSPVRRMRKWEDYPGVPGLSNAPVQGTSGDITKLALWKIYKELWINGYHPCQNQEVKLILTVHDEIELEAVEDKADWAKEMLQRNMEDAGNYILKGEVPVEAEACIVKTLAEK